MLAVTKCRYLVCAPGKTALMLAMAFVLSNLAVQPSAAQTYNVLHNFTGDMDGGNPYAGVTLDGGGNLYGTTSNYGTYGSGTAYQMKHRGSGWTFEPIYQFQYLVEGVSKARVVFGPQGALYGTTQGGPSDSGGVFRMVPSATAPRTALTLWRETSLYEFLDDSLPAYGDVIFDAEGNLYGTTDGGGLNRDGKVYELGPPGSWGTETLLYSFAGPDGLRPFNRVVFDNAGNLYGTTYQGGATGYGTVFELSRVGGSWTETRLYSFQNGADGANPIAGVVLDSAGNLYGATTGAGAGGGGTVFQLTPSGSGWTFHLLYSFNAPATCGPWGTPVLDASGNLYDTTYCSGANRLGNVFKLGPNGDGSWTYTSLHDFTGGEGDYSTSTVSVDASGNLYGTTVYGGSHGDGVVWQIQP